MFAIKFPVSPYLQVLSVFHRLNNISNIFLHGENSNSHLIEQIITVISHYN